MRILCMNDDNHGDTYIFEDGRALPHYKAIAALAAAHTEPYEVRFLYLYDDAIQTAEDEESFYDLYNSLVNPKDYLEVFNHLFDLASDSYY